MLYKQILSLKIEIFAVCDSEVRGKKCVSNAYKMWFEVERWQKESKLRMFHHKVLYLISKWYRT